MNTQLVDAIRNMINTGIANLHICLPGEIVKYENGIAEVQPLLRRVYRDGTELDLPVIPRVPVVHPRTMTAGIQLPVQKGDGCLLLFAERSLDVWLSKGNIVSPDDFRKFDLSDAIAIPGLYSFNTEPLDSSNTSALILKNKSGTVVLEENGRVNINDGNLTVDL